MPEKGLYWCEGPFPINSEEMSDPAFYRDSSFPSKCHHNSSMCICSDLIHVRVYIQRACTFAQERECPCKCTDFSHVCVLSSRQTSHTDKYRTTGCNTRKSRCVTFGLSRDPIKRLHGHLNMLACHITQLPLHKSLV